MSAAKKSTALPPTWCGAKAANETGGSPHHCWGPVGHTEAAHACPCGTLWSAPELAAVEPPAPIPAETHCPAEHPSAGQCSGFAGHDGQHVARRDGDRPVWWSA